MNDTSDANAIDFGIYTSITKATDASTGTLQTSGFYAQGRKTADSAVTHTGTKFEYDVASLLFDGNTPWFWINDAGTSVPIDFFLYSNEIQTSGVNAFAGNTNAPSFTYTNPATADAQKDILAFYTKSKTNGGVAVDVEFKHALSKVTTQIKANSDNALLKLIVTEVTYNDIKTKGECTVGEDGAIATWFNDEAITADGTATLNTTNWPATGVVGSASNDYANVYADTDGSFMFLPQQLTNVTIKYHWEQNGVIIDDYRTGRVVSISTVDMVANSHYKLRFAIEPNADEIKFNSSVVHDWDNGGDKDFDVD